MGEKYFHFIATQMFFGSIDIKAIIYRNPGHVEAYLSVTNFMAYGVRVAIPQKMKEAGSVTSVKEITDLMAEVHEVELRSGEKLLFRTHPTPLPKKQPKKRGTCRFLIRNRRSRCVEDAPER